MVASTSTTSSSSCQRNVVRASSSRAASKMNHTTTNSVTPKHHHERHYVVHNYHDYAQEPDDPAKTPIRRRKGGVTVPFPIVLHRVMTQVAADGLDHIFGWQPHGRCFLIRNVKEFVDHILPHYFKQNKLTSFQRQLNLYGFNRLTQGPDATAYYHECFLQHREYLAKRMMRQRIKGTKIKGAACPEAEPDFYQMPPVEPRDNESTVTTTPSSSTTTTTAIAPLNASLSAPRAVSVTSSESSSSLTLVSSDDMSSSSSSSSASGHDHDDEQDHEESSTDQNDEYQPHKKGAATVTVASDSASSSSQEQASTTSTLSLSSSNNNSSNYSSAIVPTQMDNESFYSSVPSATDYTPVCDFRVPRYTSSLAKGNNGSDYSNNSYYNSSNEDSDMMMTNDTTAAMDDAVRDAAAASFLDDADAMLMELHHLNPLEGFGMMIPPSWHVSSADDRAAFRALEKDQALGQMLHHVLDEYEI